MASEGQKQKRKFRNTKVWKTLRHNKNVEQKGIDPVTGRKLTKLANLHHLDQREENYTKTDNPDRFVMLNKQTHETVHFLYNYWKNDKTILQRIEGILEKMDEFSKD